MRNLCFALDTNALIRLLTEDDPEQAKTVREQIQNSLFLGKYNDAES